MVWEPVISKFQKDIDVLGYFYWKNSFQDFKKTFGLTANLKAPFYLSLDFYRLQRPELTERGWYVIRLGKGSFGIFDRKKYAKPYLDLPSEGAEKIEIRKNKSHKSLRKAFKSLDLKLKSAENTLLELARFYNIFETMVDEIDGTPEYYVGPRGGMSQQFPLGFKGTKAPLKTFTYDGQVELDYSIWTRYPAVLDKLEHYFILNPMKINTFWIKFKAGSEGFEPSISGSANPNHILARLRALPPISVSTK